MMTRPHGERGMRRIGAKTKKQNGRAARIVPIRREILIEKVKANTKVST
jgi:hypothetical protein